MQPARDLTQEDARTTIREDSIEEKDALESLVYVVAYALMFIGLIGAILPLLPGAPLIWLGALLWAWADGFERVGWPTLLVLAVLAAMCWATDLAVTTVASRRAGAGWKGVLGAIAGGLVGAFVMGGLIPLVGAIVGTIAGATAGMFAVEYHGKRDRHAAVQSACAYVIGYLIAMAVQLAICALMLGIFAWQAFL